MKPYFETKRLILRRPEMSDARRIQQLAGAYEVALNTLSMPHPYEDGVAEQFIAFVHAQWASGSSYPFCIALKSDNLLIGITGIHPVPEHQRAEIGYWIGVPYWGNGYATEAARRLVQFGFEDLKLNRIGAAFFTRNPSSARVMQKLGMTFEGTMRQHYMRFGEFQDTGFYSILRSEWDAAHDTPNPAPD